LFVRGYLRASTEDQDASRARSQLEAFAAERGLKVASWYVENESGAKLARPELFRLLADARPGDVLLVEQVDRLSRLTTADWERLKAEIAARHVRVVALDLPTSWSLAKEGDAFTARMLDALNGMLLDVLAAVARKDYEDRRRRQSQGQRGRRPLAATRAVQRTRSGTPRSLACSSRSCRDASSSRDGMQPGDDRQDRQADRLVGSLMRGPTMRLPIRSRQPRRTRQVKERADEASSRSERLHHGH
jgi:DNA invertase Pin-like site-specific DNA recombinase